MTSDLSKPIFTLTHLLLLLIGLLCSCRQSTDSMVAEATDTAIEELKSDYIAHDSLTANQLKEIKRIHHAFSEVSSTSLDAMVGKFKRSSVPKRDIAIWSRMATAYERFAIAKHIEEHDKKEEAYQLLILRSKMPANEVLRHIDIIHLTRQEVAEILQYYDAAEPALK